MSSIFHFLALLSLPVLVAGNYWNADGSSNAKVSLSYAGELVMMFHPPYQNFPSAHFKFLFIKGFNNASTVSIVMTQAGPNGVVSTTTTDLPAGEGTTNLNSTYISISSTQYQVVSKTANPGPQNVTEWTVSSLVGKVILTSLKYRLTSL